MRLLKPAEIQKARERLALSQDQFAETFHISPHTLRKWEQGQATPSGAASVLLWLLTTELAGKIMEVLKRR